MKRLFFLLAMLIISEQSDGQTTKHLGDSSTSYIMMGMSLFSIDNLTILSKEQIIDKNTEQGYGAIASGLLIAFDSPIGQHFFVSSELGKISISSYIDVKVSNGGSDYTRYHIRGIKDDSFIKNSEYFSLGFGYAIHFKAAESTNRLYLKTRLDLHHTSGYFTTVTKEDFINGTYSFNDYQNYFWGNQGFQHGFTIILGNDCHYGTFGFWAELSYQKMFFSASSDADFRTSLWGVGVNIGTSIAIPEIK